MTTKTKTSESGAEPTIVIDSREQRPYEFPNSVVAALPSGDYSILGYEERIAIERKTKADAFSSLGRHRGRFEREIQRLALMQYAAVVVEASLADFLRPPPFSQMSGRAAARSLLAWSVRYRLPVFFCGNRKLGRGVTRRLLEAFARYHREGRHPGWLMVPTLAESAVVER